ncbi:transmembrane protein, putative [Medicago truncatula]|uniref:Transmembrane protein, putative n=1 Tax=Medicago truncatula TaxID=3880 RepID=A0A072UJQ8_MEDTR|nr:transmembrane protein, putative [Medicago truncatula]
MENQKNKLVFLNPLVKLSIMPLLLLLVKFNGCFIYIRLFMSQLPKSLSYVK